MSVGKIDLAIYGNVIFGQMCGIMSEKNIIRGTRKNAKRGFSFSN